MVNFNDTIDPSSMDPSELSQLMESIVNETDQLKEMNLMRLSDRTVMLMAERALANFEVMKEMETMMGLQGEFLPDMGDEYIRRLREAVQQNDPDEVRRVL